MSLKQGPGTPTKDPVMLEILEDLRNDKPGAKERFCEYLIEDTKRTGTVYSRTCFTSLGIEEPQAYRDAVDEYIKQKSIEYAEEQKAKKSRRNKLLLVIGLIIISLICAYIFTASAHSGRTDAYGGHWNRSTGTYHYHSGGVVSKSYNTGPAPNDRYDDGYNAGHFNGHKEGWLAGYESGRKNGYELGRKDGYKAGTEYKSPHDIALMIYSPISIIAILALCIKAFKK